MKVCPNCNLEADDNVVYCSNCGSPVAEKAQVESQANYYNEPVQNQNQQVPNYQQGVPHPIYNGQPANPYAQAYNPYDHTADYSAQDISDNKVFSMLCYLMGVFGIIIALLVAQKSPYVMFHVRQAVKFIVVDCLMAIVAVILFWTFLVPIAYGIMTVVLLIIKIIAVFQIGSGKAKEPAIIRGLGFLK